MSKPNTVFSSDETRQAKNRFHQKQTSYKTIMQKTFLVFILDTLGCKFTYLKSRKSKKVRDYRIEYVKNEQDEILINYYVISQNVEREMKKERQTVSKEEIKKNANFKTITLMMDYLNAMGFEISSSTYKKATYSLNSNFRIHTITIPDIYCLGVYNALVSLIDLSNYHHLSLLHSFMKLHAFSEDEVNQLGELVLNTCYNIIL